MKNLKQTANEIRKLSLRAIHAAGSGHPGGCLSVADILAALYFDVMQPQPGYSPDTPGSDSLVLSKGHACPALYASLYLLGILSESEVLDLRKLGARGQGHPARCWLPSVVTSSGSLGQGCAFGVGLALAHKRAENGRRVYVVLGDGDLQEGVTAEAARLAAHWKLDNLVFVCDRNHKTSDGHSIDPVRDARKEFEAYGWWTEGMDGHDPERIATVLQYVKEKTSRPFFLEAVTQKGYPVSFMMDDPAGYHGSLTLSGDELEKALGEIDG